MEKILHFSILAWNQVAIDKCSEVLVSGVLFFLTTSMKQSPFNIKNILLARNSSFEASIRLVNSCAQFWIW